MNDRTLVPMNELGNLDESRAMMIGSLNTVDSLERQIAIADKYFELHDHIRKRAISLTDRFDWIDQEGKPYLQETGTAKIAMAFNVGQSEATCQKEKETDDRGDYITYSWTTILTWNNRSMSCIGTSSTRDKFFGRKDGKDLPLSEIDLMNVKKKGWTNLMNRGIKNLLGLTFTWEDIEKYSEGKIKKENCTSVTRTAGGRGGRGPESTGTSEKRKQIWNAMLEMNHGDIDETSKFLAQLTTFIGKDKKEVKGKTEISDVSEGQLKFLEQRLGEIKAEQAKIDEEVK